LSETDLLQFQQSCMRHIGESYPILSKLLKSVYELSLLKDDFTAPTDELAYSQSKFFLNLQVGDLESHLKCATKRNNRNNSLACAGFIGAYYTQGVLLKSEFRLLPYLGSIKKWMYYLTMEKKRNLLLQNVGQKDPKRIPAVKAQAPVAEIQVPGAKVPAKLRVLAGLTMTDERSADKRPTQIIPGDGISQLWTKFWEVGYISRLDPNPPQIPLTNFVANSELKGFDFGKNPKLATHSGYAPGPAPWENGGKPELIKVETKTQRAESLKEKK